MSIIEQLNEAREVMHWMIGSDECDWQAREQQTQRIHHLQQQLAAQRARDEELLTSIFTNAI